MTDTVEATNNEVVLVHEDLTFHTLKNQIEYPDIATVTNFTEICISSDEKAPDYRKYAEERHVKDYREIHMQTETQDWFVRDLDDGKMYIKEGESYVEIDNTNPIYHEKLSLVSCTTSEPFKKLGVILYKYERDEKLKKMLNEEE